MTKRTSILVVTYWSYPDALIQTYTLPYLKIIRTLFPSRRVILVTLEKNDLGSIQAEKYHQELRASGIVWIPREYYPFGIWAMFAWGQTIIKLVSIISTHKVGSIHCWATPAGAIGYLLSLLTGQPLIIDSYEPHAESMVENGTWKKNSLAFKLLFWLEQKQTKRAIATIAATAGMKNYAFEKYGVTINNFFVKPACVDLELFSLRLVKDEGLLQQLGFKNKIVCVYAGKFGGIYQDQEVFDFLKVAADHWHDSFCVLLLTSHSRKEIEEYCRKSGLKPSLVTSFFIAHRDVPKYMALADFALTPVKPVPTKHFCTPIKNGEYWALGLPVVIPSHISEDSEIISLNNIGAVLEKFDEEAYQSAVDKIDGLLKMPTQVLRKRVRGAAFQYRNFDIARSVYHQIYQ